MTITAQVKDTIIAKDRDSIIKNKPYNATEAFSCYCTPINLAPEYPGGIMVFYNLFTKNIKKKTP